MHPTVTAVSHSPAHTMTKPTQPEIVLVAGLGVADDAHAGVTVKHRSRVARDPTQPNLRQVHLIHAELHDLRQVHLIHAELHDELRAAGFQVAPGQMGENITTRGLELLALPAGARLRLGPQAEIEITGLRNPCAQLDAIQPGLMKAVLGRGPDGAVIRKAGIMATVLTGGPIRPGDPIAVTLPDGPHVPLAPV